MQILDYAMRMEKDGENYYRDLAAKSPDTGLAAILNMLAGEEIKHHNVLRQIEEDRKPEMKEGTIREDVKNVFVELQEQEGQFDFKASQIDSYRKAQEIEQKSRDFYLEKIEDMESPAAKELFYRIAEEERLHYQMLDSLIEFISRPEPGNWLENAEWYHMDEY